MSYNIILMGVCEARVINSEDIGKTMGSAGLEQGMSKRIAGYDDLRKEVVRAIRDVSNDPKEWLDIGCGTGGSVKDSMQVFGDAGFTLADPSQENLDTARAVLGDERCRYVLGASDALELPEGKFDVITAILSHHYYSDRDMKVKVYRNCHRMLRDGGVFVNVEHTIYSDQDSKDREWAEYMRGRGLSEDSI